MKNIFKYVILEQLLTENRIQQAKDKYPCIPPQLVNYLAAGDPSGNNKYLDWMCKQVWDSEGNNTITGFNWDSNIPTLFRWLEDYGSWTDDNDPTKAPYCQEFFIDKFTNGRNKTFNDVPVGDSLKNLADVVIEEVKFFHRFVNALRVKDINRYNFNTLKDALASKKLQAQEKEYAKDVQKLYEDNEWLFVSPKTHQASCAYGANTKWCVTMKNDPNYYENYTKNNEYLIFVIDKAKNKKWAIHTTIPFNPEAKETEIKLPWSQEVRLNMPLGSDDEPRMRFNKQPTKKDIENLYIKTDLETDYYNAEDDNIGYEEFIQDSGLPEKLQQLLNFLNEKFKISVARKKRTDIAYEYNPNPVRLKKGDKVKLLASGYGYFRGDEGYVIATYAGAKSRGSKLSKEDAGIYTVYVPKRVLQQRSARNEYRRPIASTRLKKDDKLVGKLNLGPDDFRSSWNNSGDSYVIVNGVTINGVFLQKI